MKLNQIVVVAITATMGFAVNAQETNTRKGSELKNVTPLKKIELTDANSTPEQTATKRTQNLKAKVQLTDDQVTSVQNLFVKIENRKDALKNLSAEEQVQPRKDLQAVEDRELNKILTPAQQKLNSSPKTNTNSNN